MESACFQPIDSRRVTAKVMQTKELHSRGEVRGGFAGESFGPISIVASGEGK